MEYILGQAVKVLKDGITKGMKGIVVENDSTDKDYKLSFGTEFQGYYMKNEIGVDVYDYELISYDEAFDKFIKGQVAQCVGSDFKMDAEIPTDKQYQGCGIIFENGYKVYHYGGGCSGEDYNTSYIVDRNGNLVATESN